MDNGYPTNILSFFILVGIFTFVIYGFSMCMVFLYNMTKTCCLMLNECVISVISKCCTLSTHHVCDHNANVTIVNDLAQDLLEREDLLE